MTLEPENHRRHSIRLSGYDYSQPGAYFITLVTHGRLCLFGEIVDGEMRLKDYGKIVEAVWFDLPNHYRHVEIGAFCIMPNHIHAVIILKEIDSVGAGLRPAPTTQLARNQPVSEIVRALKSFSSRRINELRNSPGKAVWQRNYYEHIIRNEDDLQAIHLYIAANPANWPDDDEYPG